MAHPIIKWIIRETYTVNGVSTVRDESVGDYQRGIEILEQRHFMIDLEVEGEFLRATFPDEFSFSVALIDDNHRIAVAHYIVMPIEVMEEEYDEEDVGVTITTLVDVITSHMQYEGHEIVVGDYYDNTCHITIDDRTFRLEELIPRTDFEYSWNEHTDEMTLYYKGAIAMTLSDVYSLRKAKELFPELCEEYLDNRLEVIR